MIDDPTDIANLAAWLSADTGITLFAASSNVDLWDNQEDTADWDMDGEIEATSPNVITNGAPSGRDSIRFTRANSDFMDSSGQESLSNAYTVAMAVRLPPSSANVEGLFQQANVGGQTSTGAFVKKADDDLAYTRVDAVSEVTISSGFTLDTWTIILYTVTAVDLATIRIDGVQQGQGTVTGLTAWDSGLRFGAGIGIANCDFGEFIIYSRVLTGTEITDVETYLTNRWFADTAAILGSGVGVGIVGE